MHQRILYMPESQIWSWFKKNRSRSCSTKTRKVTMERSFGHFVKLAPRSRDFNLRRKPLYRKRPSRRCGHVHGIRKSVRLILQFLGTNNRFSMWLIGPYLQGPWLTISTLYCWDLNEKTSIFAWPLVGRMSFLSFQWIFRENHLKNSVIQLIFLYIKFKWNRWNYF